MPSLFSLSSHLVNKSSSLNSYIGGLSPPTFMTYRTVSWNCTPSAVCHPTSFFTGRLSPFSKIQHSISLFRHVLSRKPSTLLSYLSTALPCTLHFLSFSQLFGINVTLRCTGSGSFHSSRELLICLWGFPSNLYLLCCKIEYKLLFCQIQFEESCECSNLIFSFTYFVFVTKTHEEKYIKSNFLSLYVCCHFDS